MQTDAETAALAAIEAGTHSAAEASRRYGVPRRRLTYLLQARDGGDASAREATLRSAEDRILDAQFATLEAAQRELLRRLTEEPHALKTAELVSAAKSAAEVVGQRRGWAHVAAAEAPGVGALASALAQLGSGEEASLTVTLRRSTAQEPAGAAIDVRPVGE